MPEKKKTKFREYTDAKGIVRKIPVGKPFSADNPPSSELQKKGWERKRVKQEIMDEMTKLDGLTMKQLERLKDDVHKHPEKHTVREARLITYMTKEKFLKDYLDRNVGKAPQDVDITSGGESLAKVTVEHIHILPEAKKAIAKIQEATADKIIEGELVE